MKPEELMRIPVSEFTAPTTSFSPADPVSKVIGFLRESGSYEAFVEENGRTAVLSIRDLLGATSASTTKTATLMRYVPRLSTRTTVEEAAALMYEHRIRALPVYKGKRLMGRVTSPAIAARLLDADSGLRPSQIMTPNPIGANASDRLSKARGLMIRRRIDQLPVMAEGRLYGVVTSGQIVFNLMPWVDRNAKGDWREGRFDTPLEMLAVKAVTNDVRDSPRAVLANMSSGASNYSLITSLGEVQGIVTYRDFLKVLVHHDSKETQMYMVGLPDDPFEAETAKSKFAAAVALLRKGFPEVTEARAIIKMGDSMSPKKKYRVRVLIATPYARYSYRVFSYELADAFDYVSAWVKRLVAQYKPRSMSARRITASPR